MPDVPLCLLAYDRLVKDIEKPIILVHRAAACLTDAVMRQINRNPKLDWLLFNLTTFHALSPKLFSSKRFTKQISEAPKFDFFCRMTSRKTLLNPLRPESSGKICVYFSILLSQRFFKLERHFHPPPLLLQMIWKVFVLRPMLLLPS